MDANIIKIRIKIADPAGYIDIKTVPTQADLPASAPSNVAYYTENTEHYYGYDGTAWQDITGDLLISDATLADIIAEHGGVTSGAVVEALRIIIAQLQADNIASIKTGSEAITYNSKLSYYNALLTEYKTKRTGRYGQTKQPDIAGGLV